MECRTCSEKLTAYLDGELRPSEREEIQVHLESCPGCREEHQSLAYSWELVESMAPGLELRAPAWRRIESRISGSSGGFFNLRWLFAPGWGMALATLLLLTASLPLYYSSSSEQANLSRMLTAFVAERDRLEMIHQGIIEAEPVGWVSHNPFVARERSAKGNPFSAE